MANESARIYRCLIRILHGVLEYYPYKLQSFQQQLPDNAAKRVVFVNLTLSEFEKYPQRLLSILWIDEAHFSLHGTVNIHKCRIWEKKNPHACREDPLHNLHVTVWCSFMSDIIVDSFFFEKPCAKLGWKTCSDNGNVV